MGIWPFLAGWLQSHRTDFLTEHLNQLGGGEFRQKGCPDSSIEVPVYKTQVARDKKTAFFCITWKGRHGVEVFRCLLPGLLMHFTHALYKVKCTNSLQSSIREALCSLRRYFILERGNKEKKKPTFLV